MLPPLQNSKGNPSAGALNTKVREKICVCNFRLKSSFISVIVRDRLWLLWVTNRKRYVAGRFVSVPMTLSDLEKLDARGQILPIDRLELHSCGLI